MTESSLYPLISCIMPTKGRRRWAQQAIRYWLRQDYPNRELIILDDGNDPIGDLVKDVKDSRIHYTHLVGQHSIGAKLNFGINIAGGDLLAIWADDDWHAPYRLGMQAEALQSSGLEVCGSDRMICWDLRRDVAARYWWEPVRVTSAYLLGGTLLMRRSFWQERQYEDISLGEDNEFIQGRLVGRAVSIDPTFYVWMLHGSNSSPSRVADGHEQFEPVSLEELRALMGDDFDWYDGLRANMHAINASFVNLRG